MLKVFTKSLIYLEFLILISCQETHINTINLQVLQDFHELIVTITCLKCKQFFKFFFPSLFEGPSQVPYHFFIYLGNYIIFFSFISVDLLSVTICSKRFILVFHTLLTQNIPELAPVLENEFSSTFPIRWMLWRGCDKTAS